ncbi:MAG: hypothetical protein GC168_03130 [Candidatus Hydrogenedens sp.]|nr:hypothetical protein [Candidatus Hydrogenedens sp.]
MNDINPRQMAILGILVVGLVGVFVYQFGGMMGGSSSSKKTKTAAVDTQPRFVDVDIDVSDLLQKVQGVNFDYQQQRTDRDPMRPLIGRGSATPNQGPAPVVSAGGVQRKSITGIVWDAYAPRAVVDDEVVGIGHRYPDGVEVYDIEEKRVTFKVGDSLIRVEMKEPGQ